MAPRPLAKPSGARVDAGATRAQAVAKDRPVKRRAQTPGPAPVRPQPLSNKALDFQWFERNLRKYPVQPLPPQAAKASRRSVTAEVAHPNDTPPGPPAIIRAALEQNSPSRVVAPAPWHETVEPTQLTHVARLPVARPPEQGPAQPERGGRHDAPKTPAERPALSQSTHTREASLVRWHGAAPRAGDRPLDRLAPKDAAQAQPPMSAPAAKPRLGKGMQALKDTIYLPFRIVNLALATLATVVTLGKAKPLLDYAVDRMGESLVGFGRTLLNVLRVTQLPEVLGMDSPRPRSASKVTGPTGASPAAPQRSAKVQEGQPLAPQQRLKSLREATDVPKRTARMTALVINQMGRAVTTSVGLGGMVVASMAITAVMPPLGILMFGLTALGAWTAVANLKCAAKNFRSLHRGEPTLPVGSSAAANAWFRGIAHKPQFRSPDGRVAARRQAAQGAKMLTLVNAGVQMAGSLASGVAAAPVVIGLFFKKLAPGFTSAVMGWVAETVASRVGARLRADAERDAWASFDQLMDEVRRGNKLPGMNLDPQLQAELRAWGIHDDDLNDWLAPTTDGGPAAKLRPRDDQAGKYLTQMTDQNFAATLLRNAAVTMINSR